MNTPFYPGYNPFGGPYPVYPYHPPMDVPRSRKARRHFMEKERRSLKRALEMLEEDQTFLEAYQKRNKKEENKKKWGTSDWWMLICGLNTITVPLFIILGVKLFS